VLLDFFNLNGPRILTFIAVIVRVGFMMIFLPFWGDMNLPARVRVALILALALLLTPVVSVDRAAYPATVGEFVLAIAFEAAFGFSVCFLVQLAFGSIQIAGQLMGEQMGFAIANVLSPDQSSQVTIATQFKYAFAVLMFFLMGFHLLLFRAIARSFEIVPALNPRPGEGVVTLVNTLAAGMFTTALQMAAPIVATMIFIDVALGLVNKAAPQVNVFLESFPLRIGLGLLMFSAILLALSRLYQQYFSATNAAMQRMMQLWS